MLVTASFFLSLSGLYFADDSPFYVRLLYWLTLIGLGIWLSDALQRQLMPLIGRFAWVPRWLIFSIVLTVPLFGFVSLLHGFSGNPISPEFYLNTGLKVWAVTAAITAFSFRGQTGEEIAAPPNDDGEAGDAVAPIEHKTLPKVLERAKPALRQATLIALSAEDHYVRLITDKGEELLLMRFADAVAETDPVEGVQVHRSWWVAREAIGHISKQGGNVKLTMRDGTEVPVSRRRAKQLEGVEPS